MKNSYEEMRVQRYKQMYPHGTRVLLIEMGDDPNPISPGTRGTVIAVDDIGTVHCTFEGIGRSLGLVPGEDNFRKLTQEEILEEQRAALANKHPVLWGYGLVNTVEKLTSYEEVAQFIMRNGVEGDVMIVDELDRPFIRTFGIYLDKVADPQYREELLKVLAPMQEEFLTGVLDSPDDGDEDFGSDPSMSM